METTFKVTGKVLGSNGFPLKQVYVSVNDKDQFMDDFLGRVQTNDAGEFVLCFGEESFNQDFLECERIPDLFLMFFIQKNGQAELIHQTGICRTHFAGNCLDLGDILIELKDWV